MRGPSNFGFRESPSSTFQIYIVARLNHTQNEQIVAKEANFVFLL